MEQIGRLRHMGQHRSVVKKRKERAMKIRVNRLELLRSWQIAMKYASSQTTNVALTGIRMIAKADDTLTLEATDMKRAVKRAVICLVDAPGEALLNAAMLGDMLKEEQCRMANARNDGETRNVDDRVQ